MKIEALLAGLRDKCLEFFVIIKTNFEIRTRRQVVVVDCSTGYVT